MLTPEERNLELIQQLKEKMDEYKALKETEKKESLNYNNEDKESKY